MLSARLAELYPHQLVGKRRVIAGHSVHQPAPTPGQRLGRVAVGRQRPPHGVADLVDEADPRRIHRRDRIRPGGKQRVELVVVEMFLVHVHQLQNVQPVDRRRLAAGGHHGDEVLQMATEALRSRGLRVERRDLAPQNLQRRAGGRAIQAGLDGRQRIPEPFQRLDTMQPNQVVAPIQTGAAIGALRRRQQADCVIVMQGPDAQSHFLRQFADFESHAIPVVDINQP
ncbi:hypothetical protein DO72_6752 [Burkholderia pseudomallei]|nr:hypothetical protein DO72_6752 [Burkholderia pseudomallei]